MKAADMVSDRGWGDDQVRGEDSEGDAVGRGEGGGPMGDAIFRWKRVLVVDGESWIE